MIRAIIGNPVRLTFLCCAVVLLIGCESRSKAGFAKPVLLFGSTGIGPGEFNYPRAGVISAEGLLHIVDKGGRIQALTLDGEFVRGWAMPLIDAGKPTGLGASPDGRIFAADTHYFRIAIFHRDGALERYFGEHGDGPGQFRLPTDVLIDPRGFIFVSEYGGNDRISKFSMNWEFIKSFGGKDDGIARLERPQCLCMAPDFSLWVADSCNHRIVHFDDDGKFLGAFGVLGDALGELRFPYNVELLKDGTLVVVEYGNNRVQRFDQSGKSLGVWGRAGRNESELAYPWAIILGPNDRLYVVDSGNNRVQVIDPYLKSTWVTNVGTGRFSQ